MPLIDLTREQIEELSKLLEYYVERPAQTGAELEWVTTPKPVHKRIREAFNYHVDPREENRGHTS